MGKERKRYSAELQAELKSVVEDVFQKLHTTTDAAEREALAEQAQEQLAKDVPWIMLGQPNFNLPVRENVSGWVQPMDGLARLRYLSATA